MNIDVSKRWWAAGVAAVLAVGAGAAYAATREPAVAAVAAAPSAPPRPRAKIPMEIAQDSLDAQSAALLAGDEKGWLAAVDPAQPKLRAHYRTMYASLRGLGVSAYQYKVFLADVQKSDPAKFELKAVIGYCLRGNTCPEPKKNPRLNQDLVLRPAGGRYLITALSEPALVVDAVHQPLPWADGGPLVFATGARVTVAGPPSQRERLQPVLKLAEKAAIVTDRFAARLGNKQPRYRIYLAGGKEWRTWYGGGQRKSTVGYAISLRDSGTDVVLDMDQLWGDDRPFLAATIQHEFGHAVTLGGASGAGANGDMWIREGIAEYIGWYPKTALESARRPAVRRSLRAVRLDSIAARAMPRDATGAEADTYYGFAHFAADCMGRTYGQPRLLVFVDQYLRKDKDLDAAARTAFGKPFATVDRTCVAWIRANA